MMSLSRDFFLKPAKPPLCSKFLIPQLETSLAL